MQKKLEHTWIDGDGVRRRVQVEELGLEERGATTPGKHAKAIGTLHAVRQGELGAGAPATGAGEMRELLEEARNAGGRAYVILWHAGLNPILLRPIDSESHDFRGSPVGAITLTADEVSKAGESLTERLKTYADVIEAWVESKVYRGIQESWHPCTKCDKGHWADEGQTEPTIGYADTMDAIETKFRIDTGAREWRRIEEPAPLESRV